MHLKYFNITMLCMLLTNALHCSTPEQRLRNLNNLQIFQSNQQTYNNYLAGERFCQTTAASSLGMAILSLIKHFHEPQEEVLVSFAISGLSSVALFCLADLNQQGQQRAIQNCSTNLTKEEIDAIAETLKYNFDSADFLAKVRSCQAYQRLFSSRA